MQPSECRVRRLGLVCIVTDTEIMANRGSRGYAKHMQHYYYYYYYLVKISLLLLYSLINLRLQTIS